MSRYSDFIPGYSDEPQYWDDATINKHYMKDNVRFIKRMLQTVLSRKFTVYEYYDNHIVVRVSTDEDMRKADNLLKDLVESVHYWRGYKGAIDADWTTEIGGFRDAEFDEYRMHKLREEDE